MRILHLLGAILVLIASPAMARDAGWIVTQKSGDVRVLRNGLQPASVQVRASLAAGDVIATGATGRAMLTRGEDYVVVAPSSRLLLPKEEKQSGFTRLVQQLGTMLYKVKHTGVPHFAVETPMLAAVVKGTSFTVVVDKDRAAVQVTEGVVEVSSAAGDARRLVEGGMTVYVGREQPNRIIEMKPGAAGLPPSASDDESVRIEGSGDVSLSTVANLTGGLVREAPVSPVVVAANAAVVATGATGGGTPSATPAAAAAPVANTPAIEVAGATAPVATAVQTTVPTITHPAVGIVETVVTPVTQPVEAIVETVITPVTQPVVQIVETVVAPVTQPIVQIVETVVTPVVEPVVSIVETVVAPVTQPIVAVVEPIVTPVTQPVVGIIETVTQPVGGLLGGPLGGP